MKLIHALTVATLCTAVQNAPVYAGSIDDFVKVAIVGKQAASMPPAYLTKPEPGYVSYYGHPEPLPAQNCYWTRMPVRDFGDKVIGWRGRPLAVCP